MFNLTIPHLVELFQYYGYFIVFPISVIEGPVVAVICGFLVSIGYFNMYVVFFVLLAGDIAGDIIYYVLGRFSRHSFIEKWGKYIGVTDARVQKVEEHFNKHDWKILLIGKTQAFGSVVLFSAGLVKMPIPRYIWYNFWGSFPKVILFMVIGYYLGQGYNQVGTYLNYVGIVSFVLAMGLLVGYFLLKRYLRTKEADLTDI